MRALFWRIAARLWPASLFGRLSMILFSGLVAAHVLAFVLIVVDRIATPFPRTRPSGVLVGEN